MIRLIRNVMCDLMPATEELPGLADTDIDGFLRTLKDEAHPILWAGLTSSALLYAGSTSLTIHSPLPSPMLSAAARDEHAMKMSGSSFYLARQSTFLLKMYAGICWGQDPDVRRLMGLEPYPADPGTIRTT